MTIWMIAALALVPALAATLLACCRGRTGGRLAALQTATSVAALALALLTFAFDQPSFVDLPLTLVLLNLPGTLAMALFLERWL